MLTVALGVDKTDLAEDDKIKSFPHVGGDPEAVAVAGAVTVASPLHETTA